MARSLGLWFGWLAFACITMPAGGAMSVERVGRVTAWVHLRWISTVIDGVMALFFLVAAAKTGAWEGASTIR